MIRSSERLTPDMMDLCLVAAAPCTIEKEETMTKKNLEQKVAADSVGKPELKMNSTSKTSRKAPGTRFGTLADWREGSHRDGESAGRYGRALRDGQ